ncbi:MAG: zinc ABC transporter substrate-binding protein, partial [Rhodospirillaceae bacterium]|nr:zinc ABC transporter substrate-binding protein [Rhodospirillaceae bacterium]
DGVIAPQLLMPATTSAHDFQLKASDARMIEKSDIIFWVGPEMEKSLSKSIATLAGDARVVALMNEPAISPIPYDANPDESGGSDGHDAHDHDGQNDPHIWLATGNAMVIVDAIAKTLIAADPDNRGIYEKNTHVAKNRIKSLRRQMIKFLRAIKDVPFVTQHDGFSYLVREFGLNQRGNIVNIQGSDAGARHIVELKKLIKNEQIKCIFTEPQMTSQMAKSISMDMGVRLGELDAMGVGLDESPTLYVRIMQKNARALLKCLKLDTQQTIPSGPSGPAG